MLLNTAFFSSSDVCTLPAVEGTCASYEEKWFYNSVEQECQVFVYNGCDGNGNNFHTRAECEKRCDSGGVTAPGGMSWKKLTAMLIICCDENVNMDLGVYTSNKW